MNRLSQRERAQIIRCLIEGNSIRATVRMAGFAKNTIVKLLVELGAACSDYQDRTLRELPCRRLELDEIWSFVHAEAKNVPEAHAGEFGYGDVWTWTAIDAETKLIPSWTIGDRSADTARAFVGDLAGRLAQRVQITTDGHKAYLEAVEAAFGADVDYAQLVKVYGPEQVEPRYSPSACIGADPRPLTGSPDPAYISTSYVERQNLTMRMQMRQFTRLTNAFSKKVENLAAAVSLHFMWYNFARPHGSLGRNVTPAMAAGVSDYVWTAEEIAGLID